MPVTPRVPPLKTIGDEWKNYRITVLKQNVGETQLEETHRAFYAGAAAVFHLLTDYVTTLPEVDAIDYCEVLHLELEAYIAHFKERYGLSS